MKKVKLVIRHSIYIDQSREKVWDFTQDYSKRLMWDTSVEDVEQLASAPSRRIKLKMKGRTTMVFVYKLDDRPNKTTLFATEVKSPFIESAGGSWSYQDQGNGTLWLQSNTLVLKKNPLLWLFGFVLWKIFERNTKQAMMNAKQLIENPSNSHATPSVRI